MKKSNQAEEKNQEEIDWDALAAEDAANEEGSLEEKYDAASIKEEKEHLTDKEKSSGYPDDFLADVNIMRKNYDEDKEKGLINDEDFE